MALGYGPKVCSTYLRINGYTIFGCWLDVCYVGYFMGYTYHWMYGYGVFLDLQEQPLHIVFINSDCYSHHGREIHHQIAINWI